MTAGMRNTGKGQKETNERGRMYNGDSKKREVIEKGKRKLSQKKT